MRFSEFKIVEKTTVKKDSSGRIRNVQYKDGNLTAKQTFRPDSTPGYQQATYSDSDKGAKYDVKGSPETGFTTSATQKVGDLTLGAKQNYSGQNTFTAQHKKKKIKVVNEAEARIQHAEDLVLFHGSAGAARALESLRGLEKGGHKDVTIKWDGSPAIIFGRNEKGQFILTDKSGFVAKGYDGKPTSPDKLANMFLNRSGGSKRSDPGYVAFANNMRGIFNAYKQALPEDFEGYYKGDLLYYSTPPVNDDGYFEFKPNIVTYQVKQDSALGDKIAASTTGVVVHRIIDDRGTEVPVSADLNEVFLGDNVFVFPPTTVQKAAQIDDSNIDKMKRIISKEGPGVDKLLDESNLVQMQMKDLPKILYKYVNSKVDTGLDGLGNDFFKWLPSSGVSGKKQQKILDHVKENKKGWESLWQIVNGLMKVKDDVIAQFDSHDQDVIATIGKDRGGEGYVLASPDGDIKLVPRATFSRANRAVQR
tara:strand:+ start:230 stop:1660 length:1431 start_codon:yes stop_codon:yes gene_type:complete